ncbi:hypothetical protein Tco_1561065 [Tanacetum coccineum]
MVLSRIKGLGVISKSKIEVVGLVRPAKTAPKQTKRYVPHSRRTASDILEEGGDDVKSAWPLWAGPHTCYNGNYNGKQGCKAERIRKDCLSSDCSLQLENKPNAFRPRRSSQSFRGTGRA